ncbi:hypothetical protein ACU686_03570 [Yinghuangia aomiensis]
MPRLHDASDRGQVLGWIPGRQIAVDEPSDHDAFFLGTVPEIMSRFAQVTRVPDYLAGRETPTSSVDSAHRQVELIQEELDHHWEDARELFVELGIPRRLDRPHDLVDAFHDRPPVVVHGDIGPKNVRLHGDVVTAFDTDLARRDDWVPELAFIMAKKPHSRVLPELVDIATRKMTEANPALAHGVVKDLPTAMLMQRASFAVGRVGGTLRRLRDGTLPLLTLRSVARNLAPVVNSVRKSLGDGRTLDPKSMWNSFYQQVPRPERSTRTVIDLVGRSFASVSREMAQGPIPTISAAPTWHAAAKRQSAKTLGVTGSSGMGPRLAPGKF